ncbi:hypothetical protein BU26DRAFT_605986 [Trematosphaeria pertusa]|uniref:Rhodopsin domain-containing protein n=1 Tax=Trematosphaeria pertusa TaxID=390896 RepID=A0A6A6IEA4_9PLEO|nr:uncharacterized protein BU26DRAFT_605986 [Trematosphaeria pertusa]KAF2248537.1 hypothetical protein BU26DRAFT_605986 [Trematosphaeria pertusa]
MLTTPPSPTGIWSTIIILVVLDIIAVVLRFSARRRLKQKLQIDDWLCAVSLVLVFGCASIWFYGLSTKSLGYPTPVDPSELQERSSLTASNWTIETARKLEYSTLCIVTPLLGTIKLSVLFFYRRLFVIDNHYKNARNLILIFMITVIALWATASGLLFMFTCGTHWRAIYASVGDESTEGMCLNGLDIGYSFAISDFMTDAIIILIPIPSVWKLHLSWGRKLAVTGVFLLGILATWASLVRLIVMVWIRQIGYDPSFDEELLLSNEVYYLNLEAMVALLASCLPTLRSLFTTASVDSVIRGVRSMFSLRSGSGTDSDSQLSKQKTPPYDGAGYSAKGGIVIRGESADSRRSWV